MGVTSVMMQYTILGIFIRIIDGLFFIMLLHTCFKKSKVHLGIQQQGLIHLVQLWGVGLNYFLKPTFEACISGHTSSGPHSSSHISEVLENQKLAELFTLGAHSPVPVPVTQDFGSRQKNPRCIQVYDTVPPQNPSSSPERLISVPKCYLLLHLEVPTKEEGTNFSPDYTMEFKESTAIT